MLKKSMAVLLSVLLLLSVVPMAASAKTTTVIYTIGSVTHDGVIKAGETITVPISVSPVEAINAMQLSVYYDEGKWEAVEGVKTDFLKKNFSFHELNLSPIDSDGALIKGKINVGGMDMSDKTIAEETVIAYVTFKALCDITESDTLTVLNTEASKRPAIALPCRGSNGKIEVVLPPSMAGDLDADGEILLADATLLFYAVNGMTELSATQQEAADLDGDGKVELNDATKLFYYVNGLLN